MAFINESYPDRCAQVVLADIEREKSHREAMRQESECSTAAHVLSIYASQNRGALTDEERALIIKAANTLSVRLTTHVTVQGQGVTNGR